MTAKVVDLKSENLVESIIKRKGGSTVAFGHGHHKRVEYLFKPERTLPNDPHVCVVDNNEHRKKLLETTEGYRLYNAVLDNQDEDDQDDEGLKQLSKVSDSVDYEDLLGLNAETVTADWLKLYAKDHLKISSSSKAVIIEYAQSNYGAKLESTLTATSLLREVMKLEQAKQLEASEAAKLANK